MNKEINLTNLNRRGKSKQIDWKNSIGKTIPFISDDITGVFYVSDYKNGKVYIKYLDNEPYPIHTSSLVKYKFGEIIGSHTKKYKYKVGDIVNDSLEIMKCMRINYGVNGNDKGYRCKCSICLEEHNMMETNLTKGCRCAVCFGKQTSKDINSIWKTHNHLVKYFKDINDSYKYSCNSNKKVTFICPDCGEIKFMEVQRIVNQGFSCPRCGDKTPLGEKILFNVLRQLHITFTKELTSKAFEWCSTYRYDFYIPSLNIIAETNGLQHYEENNWNTRRTLLEEQENDRIKKELALKNGIREQDYIVIDCRKSSFEFIKNNILNSKLGNTLDLSNVDWLECLRYTSSSLIKESCELWNKGVKSTKGIGEIIKKSDVTVCSYLKQGALLGWCDYDPKETIRKIYNGAMVI